MRQTFKNGKFDAPARSGNGKKSLGREQAEGIAVQAFVFLSDDQARLLRFLKNSGLTVENLREASGTSGFLPSVLNYICADERLASAFAQENGLPSEALRQALHHLDPTEEP
jgi:Protein of unknown function (DUF3572)